MASILVSRKNSGALEPLLPVVSGIHSRSSSIDSHCGVFTPTGFGPRSSSSNCLYGKNFSSFSNRKSDSSPFGSWLLCILLACGCGILVTWLVITIEADSPFPRYPKTPDADNKWSPNSSMAGGAAGLQANMPSVDSDPQKSHSTDAMKQMYSGIYKMLAMDIEGHPRVLSEFAGKVLLVVNTASDCPYTATNYRGLQYLQDKYRPQGFEILAFPSDQFGQEPGRNDEIRHFVKEKYHVTFTMFEKTDLNGRRTHPVFKFLKRELPAVNGGGEDMQITGCFQKFILNRSGHPMATFGSLFELGLLETEIQHLLLEPRPFA